MRGKLNAEPIAPTGLALARRDISIDYLRALATVLVLVIHCTAPYSQFTQAGQSVVWQAAVPITDAARSSVLSYVLCFLDVSTMSLMFFISGLFLYPGLRRKGGLAYLKDRTMRLGLPFLAMTLLWMPLAYYAPWGLEHPGGSFLHFYLVNARARFSSGPGWFLWLLLFFDGVMVVLYVLGGGVLERLLPKARSLGRRPAAWAFAMVLVGILLYIPPALHYMGTWKAVLTQPFVLQPARTFYYAAWLAAGVLAGSAGLDQGLLARTGPLASQWRRWALLGLAAGNLLWFGAPALASLAFSPLHRLELAGLLWALADTGICFGLLALFRARALRSRAWADSLARNAYAIYALHYVFALWIERWLLRAAWPAPAKFAVAFAGTLAVSWLSAMAWLRVWQWSVSLLLPRTLAPEQVAGQPGGAEQAVPRSA